MRFTRAPFAVIMALPWLIAGVGCFDRDTPDPIEFGKDACVTCRMTISDARFGGEVLSTGGKTFKFDALNCMGEFVLANQDANQDKVRKVYVVDFFADGSLVPVEGVQLIEAPNIRGPMGQTVVASPQIEKLKALSEQPSPPMQSWKEWLHNFGANSHRQNQR